MTNGQPLSFDSHQSLSERPKKVPALLSLPLELRWEIYELVYPDGWTSDHPTESATSLLLACRQIYQEARLLAFSRRSFHLQYGPPINPGQWPLQKLSEMDQDLVNSIKSLDVRSLSNYEYAVADSGLLRICGTLAKLEHLSMHLGFSPNVMDWCNREYPKFAKFLSRLLGVAKNLKFIRLYYVNKLAAGTSEDLFKAIDNRFRETKPSRWKVESSESGEKGQDCRHMILSEHRCKKHPGRTIILRNERSWDEHHRPWSTPRLQYI